MSLFVYLWSTQWPRGCCLFIVSRQPPRQSDITVCVYCEFNINRVQLDDKDVSPSWINNNKSSYSVDVEKRVSRINGFVDLVAEALRVCKMIVGQVLI